MRHMERFLCILLALALGGCASAKKSARTYPFVAESALTSSSPPPFRVGERLTYDVYYGLIRAGTSILAVEDIVEVCGRPTYHIVLTARTSPAFSKFISVEDRIETYVDTENFIPWKFAKNLKEGDYRCNEETFFDQENHRGHYRSLRSGRTKEYDLPERCQDTLSIFYFLRLLPYGVGDTFSVNVMADEKIWEVRVEVKELEQKTVYRGGSYDTYLLYSNAGFDSGSLRKGTGRVWISNDDPKRIVLLKTRHKFGHVTLALVKTENVYDNPKEETHVVKLD